MAIRHNVKAEARIARSIFCQVMQALYNLLVHPCFNFPQPGKKIDYCSGTEPAKTIQGQAAPDKTMV